MSEKLTKEEAFPSPEEIIAQVLAENLYGPEVKTTPHSRKKAQKITDALRRHGWRIIR